jgi:[ribosomal protein S18]-alanine N-acetyltransferase
MRVEGFRVRVAGMADLPNVVEMERAIAEAPHWPEGEYAAIFRIGKDAQGMVKRCLLVAEAEERVLGFAVGKVIGTDVGEIAELESVVVAVEARRSGVGRELCEAVAAWSREQGASGLELEVRARSSGAIAMYAGLGFVVVGRRGAYYRDPVEDALLMRLELRTGE